MPDSEGTWQLGEIESADFAVTDYGQYSPSAASDLWADAATKVQPVAERAHQRMATQVVELAAGERSFTHGLLLDEDRLLRAGANAAEASIDAVRIRRPTQLRCTYDGGVTVTILYPRLAEGTGSDATSVVSSIAIVGEVAMQLVTIHAYCFGTPGDTTFVLSVAGVVEATALFTLVAGVNTLDFLTEEPAHEITAGTPIDISLDPTSAHGIVSLLLEFQEVEA
jgi:hypothetical protein